MSGLLFFTELRLTPHASRLTFHRAMLGSLLSIELPFSLLQAGPFLEPAGGLEIERNARLEAVEAGIEPIDVPAEPQVEAPIEPQQDDARHDQPGGQDRRVEEGGQDNFPHIYPRHATPARRRQPWTCA